MTGEKFYPSEENLRKDCLYWQGVDTANAKKLGQIAIGCHYPKREMEGRLSCEGIIDDVCLYLKNKRRPRSLTDEQLAEIRFRIPDGNNRDLPPGDVI